MSYIDPDVDSRYCLKRAVIVLTTIAPVYNPQALASVNSTI